MIHFLATTPIENRGQCSQVSAQGQHAETEAAEKGSCLLVTPACKPPQHSYISPADRAGPSPSHQPDCRHQPPRYQPLMALPAAATPAQAAPALVLARTALGTSSLLGPATAVAVAAQAAKAMQSMVSIPEAMTIVPANRLQPGAWVSPAATQEPWQLQQLAPQAPSRLAGQRLLASLPCVCLKLLLAEQRPSPAADRVLLHVCWAPALHQPEGSQAWQMHPQAALQVYLLSPWGCCLPLLTRPLPREAQLLQC